VDPVDPGSPSDTERAPCPRCGESTALAGRVCPHCDGSLLVDVVTSAEVRDERLRYRAARELAALSGVPLAKLRERLANPGGAVLIPAVTREVARKAAASLDAIGTPSRAVPVPLFDAAAEVPELNRAMFEDRLPIPLIVLAAAGALVAVVLLVRHSPASARRTPAARAAAAAGSASRVPAPGSTPPPSSRDLARSALASAAALRCGTMQGAGFFVAADLLATNAHVLCADRSSLEVTTHDGRRLPAVVQMADDWLDVALLRVPGAGVRPIPLGDATRLEPGDVVLFVGSPLGMDFSVSSAIVSHPRRNVYGIAYIQFDANVNPGNSGGPLLDALGRAVGIVSMMVADSRGLGLALPVNYLRDLPGVSLPVGEPAPDFAAWRRVLAVVHDQDAAEAAVAREAYRHPGLGGAAVDPEGRVFAFVFTMGQPAGARSYRFRIRRAGRTLCEATGVVEVWGRSSARLSPGDPRLTRWLAKIDAGGELYSGSTELAADGCPAGASLVGAELELDGADPGAARVAIDRVRMAP